VKEMDSRKKKKKLAVALISQLAGSSDCGLLRPPGWLRPVGWQWLSCVQWLYKAKSAQVTLS